MKVIDIPRFLNQYISKHKFQLIIFILLSFLISILGIGIPLISGKFIDTLIEKKSINSLKIYCLIFLFVNLMKLISGIYRNYLSVILQTKIGFSINVKIIDHLQKASMSFFKRNDPIYLNKRINNDSNELIMFYLGVISDGIINALNLIGISILIANINYKILVIIISISLLYVLVYKLLNKKIYKHAYGMKESQANFFSKLNEQFLDIKFIKIHNMQQVFQERLQKSFSRVLDKIIKYQKVSYLFNSFGNIIEILTQVVMFAIGGIEIINGNLTIGAFTMIITYFNMTIRILKYFLEIGGQYQKVLVSYNRISELLSMEIQKDGEIKLNDIDSLIIKNLNFSYSNKKIISKLNLEFEKNKIYSIIGENGIGKSTLIDLLTGLYAREFDGEILFNNIEVEKLNMTTLRSVNIAVSEQEPLLFSDTLLNNISLFGNNNMDKFDCYSEKLGINQYIDSLENGLNTMINQDSSNISGGEKQKISLIRTILKNSNLLIFDEPTSALDIESRRKFMNLLQEVKVNKIIIIITHDKNLIEISDDLINLSNIL